jgi:hypothetical protein
LSIIVFGLQLERRLAVLQNACALTTDEAHALRLTPDRECRCIRVFALAAIARLDRERQQPSLQPLVASATVGCARCLAAFERHFLRSSARAPASGGLVSLLQ